MKTSHWPSSRPSSKKKDKSRAYSGSNRNNPAANSFNKNTKHLTDYLGKVKQNDFNRSSGYLLKSNAPKTASSPSQRNPKRDPYTGKLLGSSKGTYSAGSLKRKNSKSALESHIFGYTTTTATSKFLAGKNMNKYSSVDNLMKSKPHGSKPSLKVKSSKLKAKQSKNSSVDDMIQKGYIDNQIILASKGKPGSMKIVKEKMKKNKK